MPNNKQQIKTYVVFSLHCAGWLMIHGIPILGMGKRNKLNKEMNVYFFKNTEELNQKINEYKDLFKK